MTRSSFLTVIVAAAWCLSSAPVHSQSVSDSDFFSISSATVGIQRARTFSLTVSMVTKTPLMAIVLPLTYSGHAALHVDRSVGSQGITYDSIGMLNRWTQRTIVIDTTNKTILLGFLSFSSAQPPSTAPLVTIHFKVDSTDLPGVVYLDSTFIPPYNALSIVDDAADEYTPQFTRGVIEITDQVPIIRFNVTSLVFTATVNSANPPPRSFSIINDGGDVLHWTVTDNQPWLSVAPGSGVGDASPTATVDIAGLSVGSYYAAIEVTDPQALNSPHSLPVTLHVMRTPAPADSDYVSISTVVAPTRQPSKASVGISVGTTRSLEAMLIPLSYAGNPSVRIDKTAGAGGITWNTLGDDPAWELQVFSVDTAHKALTIALISVSENFVPAEGPLATIHFAVDSTDTQDTVAIDTTFIPPQSHLVYMDTALQQYTPAFSAGALVLEPFRDSLCVTPEVIYFNAIQGGPVPPCASAVVKNCGGIGWWGSGTNIPCGNWLAVSSEHHGGDSLLMELCIRTTAMDTGLYLCTLTVSGERMVNELSIPVQYRVSPPPPPDLSFECNIVALDLGSGLWDQAVLGAVAGATDGYDPGLDLFKAPSPPGEHVRASFSHPEWNLIEDDFSYDLRAPYATSCEAWILKVSSTRSGMINLQASCPRPSGDMRWSLTDLSGHLLAADFDVHGYTYPSSGGEQTFVVNVCGDGTFLAGYGAGWNLISSPLEPPDPGLLPVFGPDVDLWQLYGWDGSYFSPTEFHGCGNGYWLLLQDPETIEFRGFRCGPAGGPACFDLDLGWNLVGATFPVPSRLADAEFDSAGLVLSEDEAVARGWVSPTLWGWNGSAYVFGSVLSPGSGFWLPALVEGVQLCLNPFQGATGTRRDLVVDAVNIGFAGTDVHVLVGLGKAATGFDARYDLPLPPDGPSAVTHRLGINSGVNPLFDRYYQDLRARLPHLEWLLELVHTGPDTLSFSNTAALTQHGYTLWLINPVDSQKIPITADFEVVVHADRLVFSAELVPTSAGELLPHAWYLAANVPNPFNPQTTISFGVAVAGPVDLNIYNVLGRRVRALVSSDYGPGEYSLVWDGRDDAGRELPSGLYFYRLTATGFSESHKMMMLR